MLLRRAVLAAVGFVLVAAGCTGDTARPTGPGTPQVLASLSQPEWTSWIQDLCPPSDTRGNCLEYFNNIKNIKDAADQQAEAMKLFELMLNAYDAGELTLPANPRCGQNDLLIELICFLHEVAEHYGVEFDLPDLGDLNTDLEKVVTILTLEDFDEDEELCVPTNVGNAAGCFKSSALKLPTFFSIFKTEEIEGVYVFPMPLGFTKSGNAYNFNAYNSIDPDGEGVTALLCVPPGHLHNLPHHLFRDAHNGQAEKKESNTQPDYTCPEVEASLLKGNNLFARGVNAAGSFVMSALSPKRAYANHNLAHGGLMAFSHWQLGAQETSYEVRIVRTVPPATHTASTATFKQSGSFVLWLEIKKDGALVTCGSIANSDVEARATASTGHASAWTSANRCELVGGIPAFVVEISNPRNNRVSQGVIDVEVQDQPATPQLTYNATL